MNVIMPSKNVIAYRIIMSPGAPEIHATDYTILQCQPQEQNAGLKCRAAGPAGLAVKCTGGIRSVSERLCPSHAPSCAKDNPPALRATPLRARRGYRHSFPNTPCTVVGYRVYCNVLRRSCQGLSTSLFCSARSFAMTSSVILTLCSTSFLANESSDSANICTAR